MLTAKFKIGDKVQCIDDDTWWYVRYIMPNYMVVHQDKYYIKGHQHIIFKAQFKSYKLSLNSKLKKL